MAKITSVGKDVMRQGHPDKKIIFSGKPDSNLTTDAYKSLLATGSNGYYESYYPAEYAADYAKLTEINSVSTSAYYSYTIKDDGSITVITEPAQVLDADGNVVSTYTSLAEAVAGAEAGQTVQLLADIAGQNSTLTINKSLTLDLNGHTLKGEGGNSGSTRKLINITKGAKDVTIKSSVYGGTIAVSAAETSPLYAITVDGDDSKTLTLESGTITATNTENGITCGVSVDVTNTLNVVGATVTANAASGSSVYGISGSGSTRGWRATINMEGGSVSATSESGTSYGLNVNGKLNMSGGKVSSSSKNGTYGVYLGKVADATISVGSISAEANYNCYGVYLVSEATASITGGEITSTAEKNVAYGVASYGKTTVSGGTITATADSTSAYGVTAYADTTTISNGVIITATAKELAFATSARSTSVLQLDGGTMTGTATTRYAYASDIESSSAKINVTGGKYSYSVTGTGSTAKGHFLNTVSGIETSQVSVTGGYYPDNTEAKSYLATGYGFYNLSDDTYKYEVAPTSIYYTTEKDGDKTFFTGDDITITDGAYYSFVVPEAAVGSTKNVTYTRIFKNTALQAWFMPFDIVVTDTLAAKVTFGKILETISDAGNTQYQEVEVGDVVTANTPYYVKAKTSGTTVEFSVSNATIKSTDANAIEPLVATTTDGSLTYTITGIYTTKEASEDGTDWYALNGGLYYNPSSSAHLNPFRFYLTQNTSSASKSIGASVNDDITGINGVENIAEPQEEVIYDLQGRRVANPSKGIYIINGKKVIIK